jgi:hypothetical protein
MLENCHSHLRGFMKMVVKSKQKERKKTEEKKGRRRC